MMLGKRKKTASVWLRRKPGGRVRRPEGINANKSEIIRRIDIKDNKMNVGQYPAVW